MSRQRCITGHELHGRSVGVCTNGGIGVCTNGGIGVCTNRGIGVCTNRGVGAYTNGLFMDTGRESLYQSGRNNLRKPDKFFQSKLFCPDSGQESGFSNAFP